MDQLIFVDQSLTAELTNEACFVTNTLRERKTKNNYFSSNF